MSALCFGIGHEALARRLAARLGAAPAAFELRQFPDGEWYARVDSPVAGRDALLVADLARPDRLLTATLLLADTLRDLGAARLTLVAPYLPYLRQDARFHPGEGVTSRYFAAWLAARFDALVTVEPHLHRHPTLAAVYPIPTAAPSAAPVLAAWIREQVADGFLIGPDAESARWVGAVAARAGLPSAVLEKTRRGDREVEVAVPELPGLAGRTPVLVDDVISTGETLATVAGALVARGARPPVVVAVHGVFAAGAAERLAQAGVARIATCDTVPHATNACAVDGLLAEALTGVLAGGAG